MSSRAPAGWLAGYDAAAERRIAPPAVRSYSEREQRRDAFLARVAELERENAAVDARRARELERAAKQAAADAKAERERFVPKHPVAAYFATAWTLPPGTGPVTAIRQELAQTPLRGVTAGEVAELEVKARASENDSQQPGRARPPASGLVVDTELRETLGKIEGYAPRFSERAALLRAAQAMPELKGHRVGVCLRYMAAPRRAPGYVDPVSALSSAERRGTVQVVGRRSKVAPELAGLGPMPPALPLEPRYRGVAFCGSGWICPVCAARITEGRRLELVRACDRHRAAGGLVLLMTQTFSHGRSDVLRDAWQQLGRARQRFARSSAVKKFRERVGFVGRVACREVTYGLNGWHPHAHELVLVAGGLTAELCAQFERELAREWQACCSAVGLSCSLEHGFKISLTEAAAYVAKWGLDAELTKWQIKRGRVDRDADGEHALAGLTPFDLLRVYAGELVGSNALVLLPGATRATTAELRGRAAKLFGEYAEAVAGSAQLHWSRGLKAALEVAELSDDELVHRDESDEQLLGTLSAHEWFVLVHRNNQIEFLGLVAAQGWEVARLFLEFWVDDFDHYGQASVRRRLRDGRSRRVLLGAKWKRRKAA